MKQSFAVKKKFQWNKVNFPPPSPPQKKSDSEVFRFFVDIFMLLFESFFSGEIFLKERSFLG